VNVKQILLCSVSLVSFACARLLLGPLTFKFIFIQNSRLDASFGNSDERIVKYS